MMGGLCHMRAQGFRKVVGKNTFEQFINSANFTDEEWAIRGADQHLLNCVVEIINSRPRTLALHGGERGG